MEFWIGQNGENCQFLTFCNNDNQQLHLIPEVTFMNLFYICVRLPNSVGHDDD